MHTAVVVVHFSIPFKIELQCVTLNKEYTKNAKPPIRGCIVVQQVHLLSLLRVLELKGISLSPHLRPLSTAVLARTTCKLPKNRVFAMQNSMDVFGTGDFTDT